METRIEADGTVTECYSSLSEYQSAHPENFFPVIPISTGTADMIIASETVRVEEVGVDDVVVHHHT